MQLNGARVLVVGASSGLGRAVGVQAAAAGAQVAFAARRRDLVDEAASEAGGIGLTCDVQDPAQCRAVVDDTVAALGGLDALVYATGIDVLVRLADAGPSVWADTFATNVTGAGLITAAALPHLRRALYLSASSVDRPLPGMGVYAASKAALEGMVRGWRAEHPDVAFTTVRVGSAMPTGVYESWDMDLLTELAPDWEAKGYVHDNGPGDPMAVDQAAAAIVDVLASPVWLRDVTVVSDPASG